MIHSTSDLITAPWSLSVVTTAIRIGIFTSLDDKRLTCEELAALCKAKSHILQHLLNACVNLGLLHVDNDRYRNSQFSRIHLVQGGPQYLGDFLQLMRQTEYEKWNNLYKVMINNPDERPEPNPHHTFIRAMQNLAMQGEADALLRAVDLTACVRLIDAGGGSGIYALRLCQKYPNLHATLLDRSDTLVVARQLLADQPGADRITLREAELATDAFGKDVDVVLLSDVIYTVDDARPVLANALDCLKPGGQLIIRGYYCDSAGSNPLFGALFALNVVAFGPEREVVTLPALRHLLRETGFHIAGCKPLTERSFILMAVK